MKQEHCAVCFVCKFVIRFCSCYQTSAHYAGICKRCQQIKNNADAGKV